MESKPSLQQPTSITPFGDMSHGWKFYGEVDQLRLRNQPRILWLNLYKLVGFAVRNDFSSYSGLHGDPTTGLSVKEVALSCATRERSNQRATATPRYTYSGREYSRRGSATPRRT